MANFQKDYLSEKEHYENLIAKLSEKKIKINLELNQRLEKLDQVLLYFYIKIIFIFNYSYLKEKPLRRKISMENFYKEQNLLLKEKS